MEPSGPEGSARARAILEAAEREVLARRAPAPPLADLPLPPPGVLTTAAPAAARPALPPSATRLLALLAAFSATAEAARREASALAATLDGLARPAPAPAPRPSPLATARLTAIELAVTG